METKETLLNILLVILIISVLALCSAIGLIMYLLVPLALY